MKPGDIISTHDFTRIGISYGYVYQTSFSDTYCSIRMFKVENILIEHKEIYLKERDILIVCKQQPIVS